METLGRAARWSLIVLALPWAGALVLGGLVLLFGVGGGFADLGGGSAVSQAHGPIGLVLRSLGMCSLLGGQLVFLVCVGHRVFPGVGRRVAASVEGVLCGGFVVSLVVLSGAGVWWMA